MAKRTKPYSSFSVDDLEKAKKFYGDLLGLTVKEFSREGCGSMLSLMLDDQTEVLIYPKKDHVPASFTVLNIPVEDVEAMVKKLSGKGISFEHYDGADEQGVMHAEGPVIAWCKDPAGNFISIVEADEIEDYAAETESAVENKSYKYAEEFVF